MCAPSRLAPKGRFHFERLRDSSPATTSIANVTRMRMVARALIFGLTPRRTLEKTTIGKVVDCGPDVKLAITRSSSDKTKANNHPATSAGAISGSVT